MDIQKTAQTLIKYLGQNPVLIKQFIEHPYSTTAKATGSDARISKKDMSEVVTATAALANHQKLGMNDVANIAQALLGQNGNSVHALTSMLFGGGNTAHATQVAQQNTTPAGTLDLGSLVSLASLAATLMGGTAAATAQQPQPVQPQPAVNLSDGLDLGEIAILAGQFLSANAQAQAQAQAQQAQAQAQAQVPVQLPTQAQAQPKPGANIDFGTIAQLASILLKQRG